MADIVVSAEYILEKIGPLSASKLQKLLYYCQAWHLAWTEHPLFDEKLEAWRNGPVFPTLYRYHKGHFKLAPGFFIEHGESEKRTPLTEGEQDIIDRILGYYGHRDPHWLSQLTHMEEPWKAARARAHHSDHEHSVHEISHHSMFEYYSSL